MQIYENNLVNGKPKSRRWKIVNNSRGMSITTTVFSSDLLQDDGDTKTNNYSY